MTQASVFTREPELSASEVVAKHSTELIKFDVTEQQIARMREEFAGITFDTPRNYEVGTKALRTLRELRVGVKETHKELKAESLAYGRRVDAAAKHFTALLEDIEAPLLESKQIVDTEKARIKAEKEAAEKAAIEAKIREEREAEEARLKAIRDAEQAEIDRQKAELEAERARMAKEKAEAEARERAEREKREAEERKAREAREASERAEQAKRDEAARVERQRVEAEQKAERERLAAERRKLEDEQKAERDRAAAERQKIEEERRAVEAERQRAERAELERQTRERTERETRERIAREQAEAEAAAQARAEREAAEKAEREAMRPDAERLHAYAGALRAVPRPILTSPKASSALAAASDVLDDALLALESFGQPDLDTPN